MGCASSVPATPLEAVKPRTSQSVQNQPSSDKRAEPEDTISPHDKPKITSPPDIAQALPAASTDEPELTSPKAVAVKKSSSWGRTNSGNPSTPKPKATPRTKSPKFGRKRSGGSRPVTECDSAHAASPVGRVPSTKSRTFHNEPERLAVSLACGCLNSIPDPRFDAITTLMASLFNTPVALVSLLAERDCVFKSNYGPFGPTMDRDITFCDAVVVPDKPEVLVVEDAHDDARFSSNPGVATDPNVRFYAGAPLIGAEGYRYGTLCVVDFQPRRFAAGLYNTLMNFAELVVREMERERVIAAPIPMPLRSSESYAQAVAMVDTTAEGWTIMYANDAWARAAGLGAANECVGLGIWQLFQLANPGHQKMVDEALRESKAVQLAVATRGVSSPRPPVSVRRSSDGNSTTTREGDRRGGSPRLTAAASTVRDGSRQGLSGTPPSSREASRRGAGPPSHAASPRTKREDAAVVGPASHTFILRPAAVDALEAGVAVGIPNFVRPTDVRLSGGSPKADPVVKSSTLWFVVLQSGGSERAQAVAASQPAITQALSRTLEGGSRGTDKQPTLLEPGISKLPPASLSGIRLGALIGSGSYGRVYRGKWDDKMVAVKVLAVDDTAPGQSHRTAVLEGTLSRRLSHINVIQTHMVAMEFAEEVRTKSNGRTVKSSSGLDTVWIVQQYCNQGTLYNACERGWFKVARAPDAAPNMEFLLRTAAEIASALEYLHRADIVHGDLSGNNVLLTTRTTDVRGFSAVVADFGLSTALAGAAEHRTNSVGTVSHMPPELLSEGLQTKAADVYAFGVLLWEMFCSTRAWLGRRPAQIVYLVSSGKGTLTMPSACPGPLKELSERCLAFEHTQRPMFTAICKELDAMLLAL